MSKGDRDRKGHGRAVEEKGRLSMTGGVRGTGKGYRTGPHPGAWWAGLYRDVMGWVGTGQDRGSGVIFVSLKKLYINMEYLNKSEIIPRLKASNF